MSARVDAIPDVTIEPKVSESHNAAEALEARLLVTGEFARDITEFIEEGVPQTAAFVERNPLAMAMFFDSNYENGNFAYF